MQSKRIALTGVYNTRPGTGVLTGSLAIAGIAVAGIAVAGKGNAGSSKDHRLLNCLQITEIDENAKSKRLYVVPRPGFAANSTPRAGHVGTAIKVWTGQGSKIMSCFGTTFKLYDGTTEKGTGTGSATAITETLVSGTATLFITSDDNKGWTYQDGGALTNITDVDFPGNASRTITGAFAHLSGYPFIMDTGSRIYNGDLNSASAWTANSYVTCDAIPDSGVGVATCGDLIVGFCRTHLELFRNAGNPTGSPLSRVDGQGGVQQIGCVGQHAIATMRDTVYFVGVDSAGIVGLYSIRAGQVQLLPNAEIGSALAIAGSTNISITTLGFYGRHFVVISAASSTYVYCIEEQNWHEWTGNQYWYKADAVISGASIVNYAISNDVTTGKVYILNPANVVYADDGTNVFGTIQTTKLDFGTMKRKFWHRTAIVGDQTTATQNLSLYWSDDDYQNNSAGRTLDLSAKNPFAARCGASRRRSFFIVMPAAMCRLESVEVDYDVGSH